jgi:predicted AAA+ superfamily ATPase
MKRAIEENIKKFINNKIILLTGPRQCGKTTLSKNLSDSYDYLTYDIAEDRLILKDKSWDRSKSLIIFDELHKMPKWKTYIKGVFDKEGCKPNLLVTGSAKLDTYKKVGDSLAGRYFEYRLHPIDIKEAYHYWQPDLDIITERLLTCGGFPEPFLSGSSEYYQRWRRTHTDIILRQDLIDIQAVSDIKAIETLIELLKQRVGSTVSYANLARDLERDPKTIKNWLALLEDMYIIFRVTPYSKNIARSLLKEPKFYFYDTGLISSDNMGAKLENLVACCLLKQLQFLEDTKGSKIGLNFLRTKDGQEIDFLVTIEKQQTIIEAKLQDDNPAKAFAYFMQQLPHAKAVQLVYKLAKEKSYQNGLEIRSLSRWLVDF